MHWAICHSYFLRAEHGLLILICLKCFFFFMAILSGHNEEIIIYIPFCAVTVLDSTGRMTMELSASIEPLCFTFWKHVSSLLLLMTAIVIRFSPGFEILILMNALWMTCHWNDLLFQLCCNLEMLSI